MSNPKGNEASLKKFKPKWQNGETRTIRVPIALTDQILEYAHKLDESPSQVDADKGREAFLLLLRKSVLTLSQVIWLLEEIADAKRVSQEQKRRLRCEGLPRLESLKQVLDTLHDGVDPDSAEFNLNH
jgi:hypothetical protein